ncbi:ABC transporter permease subunit, partial [Stenotrophomonas muris]|uniref:ABC transporter permease subunit n=1 Tax=Stenotrophomonas muris TaxID=2963283 RepID=UPI003CE5AED6
MVYATPLLAVALTLVSGFLLFWALGFDPVKALHAFFIAPLMSLRGLGVLAVKPTPLVLCAIALAIGFRANVWNIGAEGQLTLGAITGGGLAVAFYGEGGWWLLPLMIVAGMAGGAGAVGRRGRGAGSSGGGAARRRPRPRGAPHPAAARRAPPRSPRRGATRGGASGAPHAR